MILHWKFYDAKQYEHCTIRNSDAVDEVEIYSCAKGMGVAKSFMIRERSFEAG